MLNLRGTLRVECGQTVLECLVSDKKAPAPRASTDALLTHVTLPSLFDPTWRAAQVLEALGAAQMLVDTEGTAPSALVTAISQGCGAHIRKHAYRRQISLTRRLLSVYQMILLTSFSPNDAPASADGSR